MKKSELQKFIKNERVSKPMPDEEQKNERLNYSNHYQTSESNEHHFMNNSESISDH